MSYSHISVQVLTELLNYYHQYIAMISRVTIINIMFIRKYAHHGWHIGLRKSGQVEKDLFLRSSTKYIQYFRHQSRLIICLRKTKPWEGNYMLNHNLLNVHLLLGVLLEI